MAKLKKHINSFLSALVALIVLASTSGFTLYSHTCSHKHITTYALFVPANPCHHELEKSGTEKPSCCSVTKVKTKTPPKNNHCTNKHELKKLDTKTVVSSGPDEIRSLNTIVIRALNESTFYTHQPVVDVNNIRFDESPPPKTTPQYLSEIQVYLI